MGYQDRDYMRSAPPSFLSELLPAGSVCRLLIALLVVCFLGQYAAAKWQRQQMLRAMQHNAQLPHVQIDMMMEAMVPANDPFTSALSLDVEKVKQGQIWRLLTYAFVHVTQTNAALQILFSVMFLWWMGGAVEGHMGSREFLLYYLAAVFSGGLLFLLVGMFAPTPVSVIGANGAVSAVALYCSFYLTNRVLMLAIIAMGVAFDAVVFNSPFVPYKSEWNVLVHLGALGFAAAYYRFHLRLSGGVPVFSWKRRALAKPRPTNPYREEELEPAPSTSAAKQPVPVAAAKTGEPKVDEHLEAKLDAVLEKIARHGQASLSESEQQILKQASEIYKKRKP
jgi:membrane associated rhomboid family serine protease